jgi:hypothetical protein
LKYQPQTIALLGAMLETNNPNEDTKQLFAQINPFTNYKVYISEKVLPTKKKWNLI